ncbi:MAG TPA: serine/threonine-protein kinase [Gemmatimonadaceae bacterium]|nr:serine/threonine-protein kinase [Gemmatimonadaceae bacterium]
MEALYWAALDHPPESRDAFLETACGDDAALRAEVLSLLAADAGTDPRAPGSITRVVGAAAAVRLETESVSWIGRAVGPYRIVDRIGQGGMGTVYLAERGDVNLRVALKVVRGPLGTPGFVDRFLRERRLLARLEHPGIARLLDAGMTDDGAPWLALEYVPARSITEECELRGSSVAERLRLFLDVCAAVAHAHANLIVHRDIKPSNVLVTADGRVKLLDFGIAKLLDTSDAADVTTTGAQMLSPAYAAPEQIIGGAITTATDVYALGVLLYELLAGVRPFRSANAMSLRSLQETLETEATRPSLAARRSPAGARRARALEGDLDAICLRALAKDPSRRYRSAEELRDDVVRHLDGLPVHAQLPTAAYRARKFLARHRAGVAAAALLFLSITAGLGAALWQGRRARQALAASEAVTSFLTTLFEASDPNQTLGRDITVRSLLDEGERRVEALSPQPLVQARMLDVMARANYGLGEHARARTLAERSLALRRRLLGDDDPAIAASLTTLARALESAGEWKDAIARYREALAIRRHSLGARDSLTTESMLQLAHLLAEQGDWHEGDTLAREALAIRERAVPVDPDQLATAQATVAQVLWRGAGELALPDSLFHLALAELERAYGPDDPRLEEPLVPLASVLSQRGKHDEAIAMARRALELRRKQYGPDNLAVYYQLSNVAYALMNAGRYAEAEPLLRQVIARYRRSYDGPQPQISNALNGISSYFRDRGQLDSAEYYLKQSMAMTIALWGEPHPTVALLYHNLGTLQRAQGKLADAESSLRRSYTMRAAIHGETSPIALRSGSDYASVIVQEHRYVEADTLLRRILRDQESVEKGVGRYAAATRTTLAGSLVAQRRYSEAEPLLTGALDYYRGAAPPGNAWRRATVRLLATVYEKTGRADAVADLRAAESPSDTLHAGG